MDHQVTLTLTRLSEPDELVLEVINALCQQVEARGELLFIEQDMASDLDISSCASARWNVRIIRQKLPGLSAARNLAVKEAAHSKILFCDADAVVSPDWAEKLATALSQETTAIAGSRIIPRWTGKPPLLAKSSVVLDQFSIYDLGSERKSVPRIVGAGFGIARDKCPELMFFDENLGRRDGRLFGGEESDLCHRVSQEGWRVEYVGEAVLEHVISPERQNLRWIAKRLFYAGFGRSQIGGTPAPSRRPSVYDWLFLPLILPPYALGWLWGKIG